MRFRPVRTVAAARRDDFGRFPGGPTPATQTAATDAAPATALDVTKESMVGNWRVSNAGASCDMFLTLTNLGSGSRSGAWLRRPAHRHGAWEVAGKQVILKDRSGNVLGRLYKSADARYDGTTSARPADRPQPLTIHHP